MKNRCQNFSRLSWRLASRETPVASSSRSFWRLTRGLLAAHSRLAKIFATETRGSRLKLAARGLLATEPRDSPSRETPRNSFLKGFLWETCFKPLPSSLKPLFQYFYIKTQPIWMVFQSINIFKVIINSFHWFWSLDYVLESFCALGWDFHHRG